MSQVYKDRERDVRFSRDYSPESDGAETYKNNTTTVRRYKVGSNGAGVTTSRALEDDDDRLSRYSPSHTGGFAPDRPRSVFDAPPRKSHDSDYYRMEMDRHRSSEDDYRHNHHHHPERHSRTTRVIEEARKSGDSSRSWDGRTAYNWEEPEQTDVRLEKRLTRREPEGDIQIVEEIDEYEVEHGEIPHHHHHRHHEPELQLVRHKDHHRHGHHHHKHKHSHSHDGVDRYKREIEYFGTNEPPPPPVVIRQKPHEQKIIVQEAPQAGNIVLPRQEPHYIVLDNRNSREDEYWRRREELDEIDRERERRRREEDMQLDRHSSHRSHHSRHESRDSRDTRDDEESDDASDYYVHRTVMRRDKGNERHKKRHVAEGALAGAGVAGLLSGRRNSYGEMQEGRGRKVLAGAALGALGTEVLRRAKSAYEDHHDDYDGYGSEGSYRHRSRSRSKSKVKTGLALGAAALAVAGGLKYMQNNKVDKEEATRGRSRGRRSYSADSYSRSPSRSSSVTRGRSRSVRSTKSSSAKAALATSAVAGLVQRYRSKSRGSSRSKSRVRTGAEIAAAGLSGAAANKLWERHKDKKERRRDRDLGDDYSRSRSRSRSRSLSRSRSPPRLRSRSSSANRQLVPVVPGVEYGTGATGYDSEDDHVHTSSHRSRTSANSSQQDIKSKRSRSRLRDIATGVLGTGAAAMGIKKYNDGKKSSERSERSERAERAERSRENSPERSQDRRSRDRKKRERRSRDRERRRYEEASAAASEDPYYNDYDLEAGPPPSPPHASGGAFYPPGAVPPDSAYYPPHGHPPPAPASEGFTQHPGPSSMNVSGYPPPHNQPYSPDYTEYPPPPPAPGPPPPGNGPRNGHPPGPENVSRHSDPGGSQLFHDSFQSASREQVGLDIPREVSPMPPSISDTWSDSPPLSSKVKFGPLSPKSSQTLRRHHEDTGEHERNADNALGPDAPKVDSDPPYPTTSSADMPMPAHDSQSQRTRERSDSDPSSNRQPALRRRRKRAEKRSDNPGHAQEEEVEELPDRFDSSGQPLEGSSRGSARGDSGWTSRRGEFEYRPRGGGSGDRNVHMQGSWGVAGTDGDAVNNIARSVGDVLEGRQGWMGLLGDVLGSFGGSGDALDGHDRSRGDHGIEDRDRDRNDHKQRRRRSSRRRDSDYDD